MENGALWRGEYRWPIGEWVWRVEEDKLNFDSLREHWLTFLAVARGEKDRFDLPKWTLFDHEAAQLEHERIPF